MAAEARALVERFLGYVPRGNDLVLLPDPLCPSAFAGQLRDPLEPGLWHCLLVDVELGEVVVVEA